MEDKQIDILAREERREYYRKWRAEHRESVRKHNQEYWRRRAEQRLLQEKEEENNG